MTIFRETARKPRLRRVNTEDITDECKAQIPLTKHKWDVRVTRMNTNRIVKAAKGYRPRGKRQQG